ncbi:MULTISPECIES: DUF4331 family protein [Novosphingopyxis]|uniref:DUF4331 family protein n=1 Tax=Novosphingopyxis TaxID=2709686 RepID=UPI001651A3F2|nr:MULTISPECIES: DUF4331 family protein [Novosphingopyxis]MBH9536152.1 DUF4331 family protein [Novosphingopyxis sp. YJ-S2-01]|tara:strand:- start:203 stop:892 length:690 start_codon:yes stop_codon:yes gene_type:complete
MNRFAKLAIAGGAMALAVPLAIMLPEQFAPAADHRDPPQRTDPTVDNTPDYAADIADVFAFHTDDKLVLILTFAGPMPTTAGATYDRDVLYKINISNQAPRTATNIPIRIRFGQDPSNANAYGMQITGIPNTNGGNALVGPVEADNTIDGVRFRAGLFDDPFFFDLQGFTQSKQTGNLSIMSTRDFFANSNDTAIVIEIPRSRIPQNSANGQAVPIDVWAETLRLGGQL